MEIVVNYYTRMIAKILDIAIEDARRIQYEMNTSVKRWLSKGYLSWKFLF